MDNSYCRYFGECLPKELILTLRFSKPFKCSDPVYLKPGDKVALNDSGIKAVVSLRIADSLKAVSDGVMRMS